MLFRSVHVPSSDEAFKSGRPYTVPPSPHRTDRRSQNTPMRTKSKQLSGSLSDLPDVILVEIFLWCIAVYSNERRIPVASFNKTYRWIIIAHICHRWRAVALSTPALWAHIDTTCVVDWLEHVIDLSRSAQLHARVVSFSMYPHPETLTRIASEFYRVRTLTLMCSVCSDVDKISQYMLDPAGWCIPTLSSAHLSWLAQRTPFNVETAAFRSLFAKLVLPSIQRLTVTGFAFDGVQPCLTWCAIRELTLVSVRMSSTNGLLAALQGFKYLESLILDYSARLNLYDQRVHLPITRNSSPKVFLPCLRSLSLIGDLWPSCSFLSAIEIPSFTRILIDASPVEVSEWRSLRLDTLSAIFAHMPYGVRRSSTSEPIISIRVESFSSNQVRLSGYQVPISPRMSTSDLESPICSLTLWRLVVNDSVDMLEHLHELFDVSSVAVLDIRDAGSINMSIPASLCRDMFNLRTVCYNTPKARWLDRLHMPSRDIVFKLIS